MEKHKVTNEHLFPQEGIIMSSGKPEDFCWNDSEEMNTQWDSPGDADLTSLAYQDYPQGETFDAVSFPRIIFYDKIDMLMFTVHICFNTVCNRV
jgi:hypothetical protein